MRATRRIVTVVLLAQVGWALPLGLVLGAVLDGDLLLAFGAVALAATVVLLGFLLAWQRADAHREALLSTGTRLPARLVSSRATRGRVNNRTALTHTFESRTAGRVIRAETRAFVHLPPGAEATIAYDAADPGRAVVVEDLDRTAAGERVGWQALRQWSIAGKFRNRS